MTLDHALGQTLYVSNRPERIVGMTPTADFLAGFSFGADNPPNAALVMETDAGETNVAMVELMNPVFDPDTQQLTYEAISLAQWTTDFTAGAQEEVSDLSGLSPEFGHAHLVIDDCADGYVACKPPGARDSFIPPGFPQAMGYCWSWGSFSCLPCEPQLFQDPHRAEKLANYWRSACEEFAPDECAGQVCQVCWYTGPVGVCFG